MQKQFGFDSCLENVTKEIVSGMSQDERNGIRQEDKNPEGLWLKLNELCDLAKDYCLFEGLGEVLDLIEHGTDGGEGSEEEI